MLADSLLTRPLDWQRMRDAVDAAVERWHEEHTVPWMTVIACPSLQEGEWALVGDREAIWCRGGVTKRVKLR
jgi:hypothetical protein